MDLNKSDFSSITICILPTVRRYHFMKIKTLILMLTISTAYTPLWADSALDSKLAGAVMSMDIQETQTLLGQGADSNYKETNRPMIAWAAQSGSVEIVQALIEAKADMNAVDGIGQTALMRAVDMDQANVVEALIKAKADTNIQAPDGKTALIMAVSNDKPVLVKALIEAGADMNAATSDNQFPALIAAQNGTEESKEIISLLGAAKANLNTSNAAYTPLTYAIEQGNKSLVEALLKAGADPNAKSEGGRAPLTLSMDYPEIFQILLDAKPDPNITNSMGQPALFVAIEQGAPDKAEALIKAGADVNLKDSYGNSPLKYATDSGNTDIAELLRKNGAQE
jgi:ankyrin repeat protein